MSRTGHQPGERQRGWLPRPESFRWAWSGLRRMVAHQRNARFHLSATVAVVIAGLLLGVSRNDWRWLLLAIGLVWTTEALNTAIEWLADAVHPQHHPLIGAAKDIAAGAVLLASLTATAIGILTLTPYL